MAKGLFSGLIAGVVAGATAGLLLAPKELSRNNLTSTTCSAILNG